MISDLWNSFRALPGWVQIWVMVILGPMNLLPLAFLAAPNGGWIALLAIGGMTPNLFIMIRERGLSKAMALPHVVIWTPLVLLILSTLTDPALTGSFRIFLYLLLITDVISLAFDYRDALLWFRGDRSVAGR